MKWRITVIVLLLGLIGFLVLPFDVFPPYTYSRVEVTRAILGNLRDALTIYLLEIGDCPSEEYGLRGLIEKPHDVEQWHRPYLKKPIIPQDAWGYEFIYQRLGNTCRVISFGADGKAGGSGEDADIQVGTVREVVSANDPTDALEALTVALHESLPTRESRKHRAGRDLGRQEPTASLVYHAAKAA